MTTLTIDASSDTGATVALIQSVIGSEIADLELALKQARRGLAVFEQRYGVTSAHFMQSMAAEDPAGGDDEYVQWAGEFTLMQRLEDKLRSLREIE
jgi:hypothetical protein